jgi:LMBR1 domain-containing protein 1
MPFVVILGLVGKVDFTVRHLSSTTTTFPSTWEFSRNQPCIGSVAREVMFL